MDLSTHGTLELVDCAWISRKLDLLARTYGSGIKVTIYLSSSQYADVLQSRESDRRFYQHTNCPLDMAFQSWSCGTVPIVHDPVLTHWRITIA